MDCNSGVQAGMNISEYKDTIAIVYRLSFHLPAYLYEGNKHTIGDFSLSIIMNSSILLSFGHQKFHHRSQTIYSCIAL